MDVAVDPIGPQVATQSPRWFELCDDSDCELLAASSDLTGLVRSRFPHSKHGAVYGDGAGPIAAKLREDLGASVVAFVDREERLQQAVAMAWRQDPGPVDVSTVEDFAVDLRSQPFDWMVVVDVERWLREPMALRALVNICVHNMRRGTQVLGVRLNSSATPGFHVDRVWRRWSFFRSLLCTVATLPRSWRRVATGNATQCTFSENGLWRYRAVDLAEIKLAEVESVIEQEVLKRHQNQGLLSVEDYAVLLKTLFEGRRQPKSSTFSEANSGARHAQSLAVIRHDVDLDLSSAVAMSEVERELGHRASYFLLHSSPKYYGSFAAGGRFFRFSCAAKLYAEIEARGQEVGLHMDPVGVALEFETDGLQAMVEEWRWLGTRGLSLNGVCGHNSAHEYGVDNVEVLRGHAAPGRRRLDIHRVGLRRALLGKASLPLGSLDCAESGFGYAADMFRVQALKPLAEPRVTDYGNRVHVEPQLEISYHSTFSLGYGGLWSRRPDQPGLKCDRLSTAEVKEALGGLPPGAVVVLNVHPVYLGRRKLVRSLV